MLSGDADAVNGPDDANGNGVPDLQELLTLLNGGGSSTGTGGRQIVGLPIDLGEQGMTGTPMRRRLRRLAALGTLVLMLAGCGFRGAYSFSLPGGADVGDHPYTVQVEFLDVLDLVQQSGVRWPTCRSAGWTRSSCRRTGPRWSRSRSTATWTSPPTRSR